MTDARHLPTISDADWLRVPATQRVFAALNQKGHVARAVGGCVRNSLFAQMADHFDVKPAVTDIDFATTATPDETLALAAAADLRSVPTGLQHGTVTIIADGEAFEVTTLRRDVSTDGRHAEVIFTDDWALDAARRDLTMNALYADADGTLFDPLGGLEDLQHRRIRFVGDAVTRIREDYLRILRFFRFFAQYGIGLPDPVGLAACVTEREGMRRLSAERIHQEFMKLLISPGAVSTLQIMIDYGLLVEVLPVVPRMTRLAQLIPHDLQTDRALRLAALTVGIEEDAERLSKALRLSRQEAAVLDLAARVQRTDITEPLSDRAARALLYRLGNENYTRWVILRRALAPLAVPTAQWQRLTRLPADWKPPTFPLDGKALIKLGAVPGAALGAILSQLECTWLHSDFALDRETLLEKAKLLINSASNVEQTE
ncbi:MAG: CCA tRNA nucleotidyltransferase [Hyphomicrobiaceae bacterium]